MRSRAPVRLVGPTGAGKSFLARRIFALERRAREQGRQVRFNVEARRRYLAFASSVEARWPGNFRELSASVTRMATLSEARRKLFAVSRRDKKQPNDADRLRKYLARFGLDWASASASRRHPEGIAMLGASKRGVNHRVACRALFAPWPLDLVRNAG